MKIKYLEFLEYGFFAIAIFLFIPLIINVVLGALAIGVSDEMTISNYFILLGEIFIGNWYFHIPAITLIIIALYIKRRIH